MPPVETVELPLKLNIPKPRQKIDIPPMPKTGRKSIAERMSEDIETQKEQQKDTFILPLQESEEAKMYTSLIFSSVTDKKGKGDKKK